MNICHRNRRISCSKTCPRCRKIFKHRTSSTTHHQVFCLAHSRAVIPIRASDSLTVVQALIRAKSEVAQPLAERSQLVEIWGMANLPTTLKLNSCIRMLLSRLLTNSSNSSSNKRSSKAKLEARKLSNSTSRTCLRTTHKTFRLCPIRNSEFTSQISARFRR